MQSLFLWFAGTDRLRGRDPDKRAVASGQFGRIHGLVSMLDGLFGVDILIESCSSQLGQHADLAETATGIVAPGFVSMVVG
jgi:hypothetical protein